MNLSKNDAPWQENNNTEERSLTLNRYRLNISNICTCGYTILLMYIL